MLQSSLEGGFNIRLKRADQRYIFVHALYFLRVFHHLRPAIEVTEILSRFEVWKLMILFEIEHINLGGR